MKEEIEIFTRMVKRIKEIYDELQDCNDVSRLQALLLECKNSIHWLNKEMESQNICATGLYSAIESKIDALEYIRKHSKNLDIAI